MNARYKAIALLCLASVCQAKPINWQKLSQLDLTASHRYLQQDAIGGADSQNPAYHTWLNQGYQTTLKLSQQVNGPGAYYLLLNQYMNGFHDEHIQYVPYLARFDFPRQWPGFTVTYRRQQFLVSHVAYQANAQRPPIGAQLLSCDGQTVQQLMQQRVFPYFGNAKLQADWHINAPHLFFYPANPWFKRLQHCRFKLKHDTKTYALHWHSIGAQRAEQIRHLASYPPTNPIGVEHLANGTVWVSLPTFMPHGDKAIHAMQQVIKQARQWRHAKRIVLDTRGNTGGLSLWGSQLLQQLYGTAYYQQQTAVLDNPQYQWRVSAGNLHELTSFYLPMVQRSFGNTSSQAKTLQQTIAGMQHSLQQGKNLYPATVSKPVEPKIVHKINNPVTAKIDWLTNGLCASACLTFGDQLTHFPNVTQTGEATHADTNYTESRLVTLPSGGHLYFPMKVQRFRLRKNNQPYIPHH